MDILSFSGIAAGILVFVFSFAYEHPSLGKDIIQKKRRMQFIIWLSFIGILYWTAVVLLLWSGDIKEGQRTPWAIVFVASCCLLIYWLCHMILLVKIFRENYSRDGIIKNFHPGKKSP